MRPQPLGHDESAFVTTLPRAMGAIVNRSPQQNYVVGKPDDRPTEGLSISILPCVNRCQARTADKASIECQETDPLPWRRQRNQGSRLPGRTEPFYESLGMTKAQLGGRWPVSGFAHAEIKPVGMMMRCGRPTLVGFGGIGAHRHRDRARGNGTALNEGKKVFIINEDCSSVGGRKRNW
ncbi:hypothetical protein LX36DRAFT_80608 [Colletotrichum falcatum]|nr:hypothetical protein LX36DRAFT_80608 [Colletotrichum falcatum]